MIADKIAKLLALAENVSGTPEGITAASIAMKLMKEHAIEYGDLAGAEEIEQRDVPGENLAMWRRSLVEVVAKHCQCRSLKIGPKLVMFGHTNDLETALYLLTLLEAQVASEGWTFADARRYSANRYTDVDSFLRTVVIRLHSRLSELRAEDEETVGTALVVQRGNEVDAFVSARSKVDRNAYSPALSREGLRAGDRIRLGLPELD
jgi:hypothetical protein